MASSQLTAPVDHKEQEFYGFNCNSSARLDLVVHMIASVV